MTSLHDQLRSREGTQIPSLRPIRLRKDDPINTSHPLPGMNFDDLFLILGEVANINHYIILNYGSGQVMPGMYDIDRFEWVPEGEF